jgi:endoglycosylceramidase
MPKKGQINQTYINEMAKIIDKLSSYGIYTLIDLHQDMMSSRFASYDG